MKVLLGKRQSDVHPTIITELIGDNCPVHIDVGTGSGRLMLKKALKSPNGFYIGMDSSAACMTESSVKAEKYKKKKQLGNILFIVAPIEAPPKSLLGIADSVSVILPWGSLRNGIVKADPQILYNLRKLGKTGTALEILVGYEERFEPTEMEKHSLPALSHEYFHSIIPAYKNAGIIVRKIKEVGNGELKLMESDWAKKLAYGGKRIMYSLYCEYI